MTKPASFAVRREESKSHDRTHHQIESNILCLCLRHRILKIKQMPAEVVCRYCKYYEEKNHKPLPIDVVAKIEKCFYNCIVRCAELLLTVDEEVEWNPDLDLSDELELSDSGDNSESHSSDDVVFDSRDEGDDDNDYEDDEEN
jgi:hypothetical protein